MAFFSCAAKEKETLLPLQIPQLPGVVCRSLFDPSYKLDFIDAVQDKNFYLCTLLLKDERLRNFLNNEPTLIAITKRYQLRMTSISSTADMEALKLSSQEIADAATVLTLLADHDQFKSLIKDQLRPTGMYENYNGLSDSQFLNRLWFDVANSINHIIDVYLAGKTPKYPLIDGPLQDVHSSAYLGLVKSEIAVINGAIKPNTLFFEPSLKIALMALSLNGRNEAARFEPLQDGENKAALESVANVKWANYRYSVIICPGDAPNSAGDSPGLSEGGKARVKVVAQRYLKGLAPFIVMTGANVFPKGSKWFEAIEMKKYILQNFPSIPESAIIVEPHARHTHTNLRNTARLIFRYKIPDQKKVLITTTASQAKYILGTEFERRCMNDFGYLPMDDYESISVNDIEALPQKVALHILSIDPLDP